jgi:hypothetical protein
VVGLLAVSLQLKSSVETMPKVNNDLVKFMVFVF